MLSCPGTHSATHKWKRCIFCNVFKLPGPGVQLLAVWQHNLHPHPLQDTLFTGQPDRCEHGLDPCSAAQAPTLPHINGNELYFAMYLCCQGWELQLLAAC